MKKSMMILALSAVSALAMGHEGAEGVELERMELMKDMGPASRTMGLMFRGRSDFEPAVIQEQAKVILERSGSAMTDLFPEGEISAHSEALPNIWSEWEQFEQLANLMGEHAQTLIDASEDKSEAKKAYTALTETCSDCHQQFRQKRR